MVFRNDLVQCISLIYRQLEQAKHRLSPFVAVCHEMFVFLLLSNSNSYGTVIKIRFGSKFNKNNMIVIHHVK